jgi:hypothetical protein
MLQKQLMAGQDGVVWLPNIDHTNIASADNDDNPMDWQYYQVCATRCIMLFHSNRACRVYGWWSIFEVYFCDEK